jgi:hypothetical protein
MLCSVSCSSQELPSIILIRVQENIVVAEACGDHRENLFAGVNAELNHD